MSLDRRSFLKLLATGIVAIDTLDVEKLLWVPGEKIIFIPSSTELISLSEIIELEMNRLLPYVRSMFERDDFFYKKLAEREMPSINTGKVSVPINFRRMYEPD